MKNLYTKEKLLEEINQVRKQIGHEELKIHIKDIYYNKQENEMWIITEDRPDKSAIIGKGGWVVGKLREKLKINSIHVESYGDFLVKEYKLKLSKRTIDEFNSNLTGIKNLKKILNAKLENIYNFDYNSYFKNNAFKESENTEAIVALSGGVDSSFSLILAKYLGFNPLSITIDPGTIILPNQYKKNIKKLTDELNVKHEYIKADYNELINESLNGRFHPCGRCSKNTEKLINEYAITNNIPIVIFGDMLSTGTQCITPQENGIYRLNLPASLSVGKQENKSLSKQFNLQSFSGFGCPLLYEVHRKYPYLKKYSIQRILRETRSSALEVGEALDLIWSFYNTKD
ncbi:ATPase [uncultured Methanobrevibacter sp.]|uniref:ATPase n=1 Tax=uncultured Methanobrevibacter sp. TaxID=253161 RepID=UPI002611BB6D|nr:ATPase [uncultured Methanobrevibacter sp.]